MSLWPDLVKASSVRSTAVGVVLTLVLVLASQCVLVVHAPWRTEALETPWEVPAVSTVGADPGVRALIDIHALLDQARSTAPTPTGIQLIARLAHASAWRMKTKYYT